MHICKKIDQFNIVVVGTGGQGLITLLQVIAEAAVFSGLDVKTSELHGLSQRGGSVEVHIRFGRKIYSPLVAQGGADLVIALEMQESLRAAYFANPKTNFLINKYFIPIPLQKTLSEREIVGALQKISQKIEIAEAGGVTSGIYLLSLAGFRKMIPLQPGSILRAIKKVMPGKYFAMNKKAFDSAEQYAQK